MDVVDRLKAFVEGPQVAPSPLHAVAMIQQRLMAQLPQALLDLWAATDGAKLDRIEAGLIGPSNLTEWLDRANPMAKFLDQGFVPFVCDRESNYLIVTVKPPLAYRVVYLPHDDGARLVYRSVANCLTGIVRLLEGSMTVTMTKRAAHLCSHLRKSKGDYADGEARTIKDQDAARVLIRSSGKNGEWNYAVQLLDEGNVTEWHRLLETGHSVRRDVKARMGTMTSPAIRDLLREDAAAFEQFATGAAEAFRAAGLAVGDRRGDVLGVGGKWINLDASFCRRRIEDAVPRMVAWVTDLIDGQDPRRRPEHYLAD